MQSQPITLLICALGGEGGGVLTQWLVETARRAGFACQSTSIPGVAQRTGATTYYIEVFPVAMAQLHGRRPVFSLNPVPGALDAMVSSELLETTRQIASGMTSPDRTTVITSSSRAFTTRERMQMADGRVDSDRLLEVVQAFSRSHHVLDMDTLAKQSGTAVSAVMLGAIAGSGLFPFGRADYENVVRASGGKGAEASLRGFARSYEIVHQGVARDAGLDPASTLARKDGLRARPAMTAPPPATTALSPAAGEFFAAAKDFPSQVHDMLALGHARMLEYQGPAYANLYLKRLRDVLAAERVGDPSGTQGFATTREMARWLALWMAFDDIVRVADLKSRVGRWQRVKGEVKAGADDLLRVYDYFKPGAAEFAALLPPWLARRVLRWNQARIAAGQLPWALPLEIRTHSVTGMLALRALAAMKGLRARGSRYANEQAMIGRWLTGVIEASRRDWQLGHEIALCGRLIKGYGATNERGKENLLHVLDHLAHGPSAAAAAHAVAAAREAALADDAGNALDATLVQHGAPARPIKPEPIRWMRLPPRQGKA